MGEHGMRCYPPYLFAIFFAVCLSAQAGEPIHEAVISGDYEKVDKLIESGADLKQKDGDGNTALQLAVNQSDTAMVRTLVLAGAPIDAGPTVAAAYQRRDNPTINLLLNAGVDPNVTLPETGQRLLDVAVADGSLSTVRSLLKAKADPGDHFGKAMLERRDDLVLTFLQSGDAASLKSPDGTGLLDYALKKELYHFVLPILQALSPEPSKEPWLSRALRNGHTGITMALLKDGFPLGNGRTADYHTMLGWAIANGMDEVALYLIDAGVDVNMRERYPATPLFIEKFSESKSFQRILARDRGVRPLMMVPVKKNYKLAKALIDAGATNSATSKYNYPISIASWFDDVRMMQIIFGRDPDVQPRKLVIDLSSQKVELYEDGKVTYTSKCSTGKKGYETETGTFVVTQKRKRHVSSIYGSSMPNFMRLSCSDFGLHTGVCPGYPASHGCIRLPSSAAIHYYKVCTLGDIVVIQE